MVDGFQVADYFSSVLRRGTLDEVAFKKDSLFVGVDRNQLLTGSLGSEDAAKLFAGRNAGADQPLDVAVSLVTVNASLPRGEVRQDGLFLLAARLHSDGRLEPELEPASSPWIPSCRLESPSVGGSSVPVGQLSDFWKHSRSTLPATVSQSVAFADAMDLATDLFEAVAGEALADFASRHETPDQSIEYGICYVQAYDRINAVGGILDLYDALGREKVLPATVAHVVNGWRGSRRNESSIHDNGGLLRSARLSCGSMSDGFPLTDSQRRAVHAFLDESGSEVTAVSGPPGTGKTTMLQSVVANLLTRHALDRRDPPVVVGTSTNNQAVTNIISSFAAVTKDEPGPLDFRWLLQENGDGDSGQESLRSLAVYCPAQGKLGQAKKQYLVEQADKGHTYTLYSSESYLARAKDRFVSCASSYFGGARDIPELQQWIHDAMNELDKYRLGLLDAMGPDGPSRSYAGLCRKVEACTYVSSMDRISELKDCESLERLDQLLDVTLRYAEFWLAVHYYEAQWLLTDNFIEPDKRRRNTREIMGRYWSQAAALTPCFVMTVYQLPKYFRLYAGPDRPSRFDLGRIDLLIVDEAGQVDTPLGLPSFALASRVMVVGDEKQLSPVWSIDEQTDREVALDVGISGQAWLEELQGRGATCSEPSSLMRAASHASNWSYGNGAPGLFLSEHFRCHPGIIEFCNTLLYEGMLEARRPAGSSKLEGLHPAFSWVDVAGSTDSTEGSSRKNLREAQEIAAWIVANYAHFFDIYNTEESEPNKKVPEDALIGVVTPFSAQASLISAELRKAVEAAGESARLPHALWKKITVGTAHRLQGAERPIVLFSAAYGLNSPQAGFIDAIPKLMNVAVSRAKDLFVVFAAGNRWNNGPVFSVMSAFASRADLATAATDSAAEPTVPQGAPPLPTHLPAVAPPPPARPPAIPPVADPGDASLSLTRLLDGWKKDGHLRAGDEELKVTALNERLRAIGVLEGARGAWTVSKLAEALGVVVEERRNAAGQQYELITYTPWIQSMLLKLYQEEKL